MIALGIMPAILAGRWDDLTSGAWADHAGLWYAFPFGIALSDITHLILAPGTDADRVADITRHAHAASHTIEVTTGRYADVVTLTAERK